MRLYQTTLKRCINNNNMIKQYIKQALQMLKENRFVSTISIAGTAISIAMIMVVVLIFQIQVANFSPENHRDRMLYVPGVSVAGKQGNNIKGGMSDEAVRECFRTLKSPEAVSAFFTTEAPLSIPGKRTYKKYNVKMTDASFYKIFSFDFIEGTPFTDADFSSAIPRMVVSEGVARQLYGTVDVAGKTILYNNLPYTVCGVVKNVSRAADTSFGDVWIPYTTDERMLKSYYGEGMTGALSVCLLAAHCNDFDAIRTEIKRETARYNATKKEYELSLLDNPITRFDIAIGSSGTHKVKLADYMAETGLLLLFLLLIPALNLIGVTQSFVQKRQGEIGVRKAFGASFLTLILQILNENLVLTLMGGLLGLALAFPMLYLCKEFMLNAGDVMLNADMLFQPGVFVAALFFCLLLNVLSAGIPAVKIARSTIVKALKEEE